MTLVFKFTKDLLNDPRIIIGQIFCFVLPVVIINTERCKFCSFYYNVRFRGILASKKKKEPYTSIGHNIINLSNKKWARSDGINLIAIGCWDRVEKAPLSGPFYKDT